jgi:hypothetical protein
MKARCMCVYRCWINESPYTIVLIVPVCASMVLNLIFLCNILRVLLLKLRAGPRVGSSRPSSTLLQVCLPSRDPLPTHKPRTLLLRCIYLHPLSEKFATIDTHIFLELEKHAVESSFVINDVDTEQESNLPKATFASVFINNERSSI